MCRNESTHMYMYVEVSMGQEIIMSNMVASNSRNTNLPNCLWQFSNLLYSQIMSVTNYFLLVLHSKWHRV